jgi:hypothetical protein
MSYYNSNMGTPGAMSPGAAANTNSEKRPLRVRIPGVIDVVLVSEAKHIEVLNQHPGITRKIDAKKSVLHRIVASRLLGDLSFHGKLLPVFLARDDQQRAARQKQLDEQLEGLRGAPGPESAEIASYVSGVKDALEIGVQVQQWCGKLFLAHYRASRESYEAGKLIAGWASAPPWRSVFDKLTGKLDRAKSLLAEAAEGDPHIIHATSIGMENIAKSVRKLRKAAHHPEKQRLSPDDILRECLAAPPAVLRSCTQDVRVEFLAEPLTQRSLVVFLVAKAYASSADLDVAFLGDQWSACPARRVVPEMLRAAWHTANHDEPAKKDDSVFAKINGWGRFLNKVAH